MSKKALLNEIPASCPQCEADLTKEGAVKVESRAVRSAFNSRVKAGNTNQVVLGEDHLLILTTSLVCRTCDRHMDIEPGLVAWK